MDTALTTIQKGIYKHYKDQYYEVLDIARHTETLETLVVYRSLYGSFDLWVRPLAMFLETVTNNGVSTPRFQYIGNQLSKKPTSDTPPLLTISTPSLN